MSSVIDFVHLSVRYSHIGAGFLGLALYWIPIFAVKGSRLHIRVGKIFIWCAAYVGTTGLILSFALAAYGAWNLYLAFAGQHFLRPTETGKYWIPTILGLFGIHGAIDDLKYILRPRPTPMAWWYKHMENMIGIGIGFHTAFLVLGLGRLLNVQLRAPWQIIPWLLPAAVGLPAGMLWTRYYKKRFGELELSSTKRESDCKATVTRVATSGRPGGS
jgi:hypothetical protein